MARSTSATPSPAVSPVPSSRSRKRTAPPTRGMTMLTAIGAGFAAAIAAKRQMTFERLEGESHSKPKRAGWFRGMKAGVWQGLGTNYPGVQEVLQAGVGEPAPAAKPFTGLKRPGRRRSRASFSSCESHDARHLHGDVPAFLLLPHERGIRTGRKTR